MAKIRTNPKFLQEERRLANKIARRLKKLSVIIADRVEAMDTKKGLIEDIFVDLRIEFEMIADDIIFHDGRVRELNEKIQLRRIKQLWKLSLIDINRLRSIREVYLEETRGLLLSPSGWVIPTTTNRVRELISEWLVNGTSYTAIATQIRKQAQEWVFSVARSQMIAVNQLKRWYEAAWTEPYKQLVEAGILVRKRWMTVWDDRVTETHAQNEADWRIHFNDTFSGTWDQYPPWSDNPRCRCTQWYEVDGVS